MTGQLMSGLGQSGSSIARLMRCMASRRALALLKTLGSGRRKLQLRKRKASLTL